MIFYQWLLLCLLCSYTILRSVWGGLTFQKALPFPPHCLVCKRGISLSTSLNSRTLVTTEPCARSTEVKMFMFAFEPRSHITNVKGNLSYISEVPLDKIYNYTKHLLFFCRFLMRDLSQAM